MVDCWSLPSWLGGDLANANESEESDQTEWSIEVECGFTGGRAPWGIKLRVLSNPILAEVERKLRRHVILRTATQCLVWDNPAIFRYRQNLLSNDFSRLLSTWVSVDLL